ncbi:MAG: hypothetical protein PVF54_09580 [Anaerolineae bacterium]
MTALWLLAGGLVGVVNGLIRWCTVAPLRPGMRIGALSLVLSGMAVRLGLVVALLILGLKHGFVPGLLAFAGLWLARSAIVLWVAAPGRSEGPRTTASRTE